MAMLLFEMILHDFNILHDFGIFLRTFPFKLGCQLR